MKIAGKNTVRKTIIGDSDNSRFRIIEEFFDGIETRSEKKLEGFSYLFLYHFDIHLFERTMHHRLTVVDFHTLVYCAILELYK